MRHKLDCFEIKPRSLVESSQLFLNASSCLDVFLKKSFDASRLPKLAL